MPCLLFLCPQPNFAHRFNFINHLKSFVRTNLFDEYLQPTFARSTFTLTFFECFNHCSFNLIIHYPVNLMIFLFNGISYVFKTVTNKQFFKTWWPALLFHLKLFHLFQFFLLYFVACFLKRDKNSVVLL